MLPIFGDHPDESPGGHFRTLRGVVTQADGRWLEHGFTGLGVILIVLFGIEAAGARIHQAVEGFRLGFERAAAEGDVFPVVAERGDAVTDGPPARRYRTGETIATIEIPRIGLAAIVSEGDDASTLGRAVGHVPSTALPGETGNVGLAAHRDGFFGGLRYVRIGDAIRLVTRDRVYDYAVADLSVVRPEQVEVLAPTAEPALTLVTCYPFGYVGSAPDRFIVRARQIASRPLEEALKSPVAPGRASLERR